MSAPGSLPRLGRYEVIRVLGRGAMGMVYEARDPNLDRRVAIKTIRVDGLTGDAADEYAARFRTEARSAARLQHPHIVSVYDSDRDGEVAYLVMEYVQGEDLKHHLDAGMRFTLEQTLRITADLLSALDYAHRQNIVHRDVKPANLLLEASGRVKLADFGVARIQDAGEATRTRGSMVGTLKYMSPEQVQGQPVDARSDLFAAGVVLYQLLTGRRPFEGDTDFAIIHQIVAQPLVPASSLNPQLPASLDAVLGRAMAKAREDRFPDAQSFLQALQEACGDLVDRSILAPPNPQGGAFGTGSTVNPRGLRTGGSTAATSLRNGEETGATVTQELELVYWKDVRDSPDMVDLEGFLARFPDGIYADLARRRLRKLAGQDTGTRGTAYDATRMEAPTTIGAPASPAEVPDTTVAMPAPARPPSLAVPPALAGDADAPPPVAAATPEASLTALTPAALRDAATSAPTRAETGSTTPAVPAGRRRSPAVLLVGAAAIVVVSVLVYRMLQPGDAMQAQGAAAVPALSASTPDPLPVPAAGVVPAADAATAAAPASGPASLASAVVVPPLAAAASAPAAAASAGRNPPRAGARQVPASGPGTRVPDTASGSGPATGGSPAPAAVSAVPPSPPPAGARVAAPAAAGAAADPRKACEGRVLLGYQVCLNEQCALPTHAQHPVCVERREADKVRRERFHNERN